MAKIWVTGANGQLGNELQNLSKSCKDFEFVFTDMQELDLTKHDDVKKVFKDIKPEIVINTAAYTSVDLAEMESVKAYAINANAVANLAALCSAEKSFMLHISTDFVFDGKRSSPYHEEIAANPIGVYAASKNKGEIEILLNTRHAAIIRTSWLYGNYGNNFMKTIRDLGRKGEKLKVVYDQVGTPTWSADLAKTVLEMARRAKDIKGVELFHYSNEGVASWYDFAYEILNLSNVKTAIVPVESKDFQRPAPRPAFSVLNKGKIKKFLNIEIPHWKDSLKKCFEQQK